MRFIVDCLHDLLLFTRTTTSCLSIPFVIFIAILELMAASYFILQHLRRQKSSFNTPIRPCSVARISEQLGSMKALNIELQALLFHSRTLQRSRTDPSTNHKPQCPCSIYQSPFQTTGIANIHRFLLCLFSLRQAYCRREKV